MIHDVTCVPPVFAEAEKISLYALAALWSDRVRPPNAIRPDRAFEVDLASKTVDHDWRELATMAALPAWLGRWMGTQIHVTLRQGAGIEQIAAAPGSAPDQVISVWRAYDRGQRGLWESAFPVWQERHKAEHDEIAARLLAWKAQAAIERIEQLP